MRILTIVLLFFCQLLNAQVSIKWSKYPFNPYLYHETKDILSDNKGFVYSLGENTSNYLFLVKTNANTGATAWIQENTTVQVDTRKLVQDANGNIYILGKSLENFQDSNRVIILKYTSTGNLMWTKKIKYQSVFEEEPVDMKIDQNGKIFICGNYNASTSGVDENIVLFRLDTLGNLVWKKNYKNGQCSAYQMAIDNNANIFLAGSTDNDFLNVKFNQNGTFLWYKKFNRNTSGYGYDFDLCSAVKVDGNGDIVFAGTSNDGHSSGINWTEFTVIKYDQSGNQKWLSSHKISDVMLIDSKVQIEIENSSNNIYYYTWADTSISFNSYLGTQVGKFDSNGNFKWAKSQWTGLSGSNVGDKGDFAIDISGNVYYTYGLDIWDRNIKTYKYNNAGGLVWSHTYFAPFSGNQGFPCGLTLDSCGRVYVLALDDGQSASERPLIIAYQNPINSTLTVAGTSTICAGSSTQLSTTSNLASYNWYPSTSLNNSNIYNPVASPLSNTTYTITGTNNYGCYLSGTFPVGVNLNNLEAGPDQIITAGQTTLLNATGMISYNYSWTPSSQLTSPAAASTLASLNQSTKFTVQATISNCIYKDSVQIIVKPFSGLQNDQSWMWAVNSSSSGYYETINKVSNDGFGNVLITGSFGGTININGTSYTATNNNDFFIAKVDYNGNFLWFKIAGGTYDDEGTDIVLDSRGNIYVSGTLSPSAVFESNVLNNTTSIPFIAKYNSNGNFEWIKTGSGTGEFYIRNISIDNGNNLAFSGYFSKAATLGSFTVNTGNTNTFDFSIFWGKMDSLGTVKWLNKAGGTGNDRATDIETDNFGNIYITGNFNSSTATFGSYSLSKFSSYDGFLFKSDSSGNIVWIKQQKKSTSLTAANSGLAINKQTGTTYLTGSIAGSNTFGSFVLTASAFQDIFILKHDINGNIVWAKSISGTGSDAGNALDIDQDENIYLTGKIGSSSGSGSLPSYAIFGNDTVNNPTGKNSIIVSKIDSAGNFSWSTGTLSTGNDNANTILNHSSGIFVGGSIASLTNFDTLKIKAIGNVEFFLAKLKGGSDHEKVDIETAFIAADSNACSGKYPVGVVFKNTGIIPLTSVKIICEVNDQNSGIKTWTGNIIESAYSDTIYLVDIPFIPGTNEVKITIRGLYGQVISDTLVFHHIFSGSEVNINTSSATSSLCEGDSLQIFSDFAGNNLWSNGFTGQILNVLISGSYFVQITDSNGCQNYSDTLSINFHPLPVVNILGDASACIGDTIELTSDFPGNNFWSNGSNGQSIFVSTPGNYFLQVTDSNGCLSNIDSINIVFNPVPSVNIIPSTNNNLCIGDSIQLTSDFTGNNYWSNAIYGNSIIVFNSGNFSVIATDLNGCIGYSDTLLIEAKPLPDATFTVDQTEFCEGDSATLSAINQGSYLWSEGSITPIIKINSSGSYFLSITDSNGCSATSNAININVKSVPNPVIVLDSLAFCTYKLNTDSLYQSYLWNTGDTTKSIYISQIGTYSLTVTDNFGCSNSISSYVLTPECNTVWPGDANNDLVVNNLDILSLGLYYGEQGPSRDSISNLWMGHHCQDWSSFQNNMNNKKFIDCNGDGAIDDNDTLAIHTNFSNSYSRNILNVNSAYPISISLNKNSFNVSDTVVMKIMVGNLSNPADGLYGMAFNISCPVGLIRANSGFADFDSSWLYVSNQTLTFLKFDDVLTNAYFAITGKDHTDKNGWGEIARVKFVVDDLIEGTHPIMLNNIFGINSAGLIIPFSSIEDSINIQSIITNVSSQESFPMIKIFPNPASNEVNIEINFQSNQKVGKFKLFNSIGKLVYVQSINENGKFSVLTKNYSSGIYFYQFNDNSNNVVKGKIVINN